MEKPRKSGKARKKVRARDGPRLTQDPRQRDYTPRMYSVFRFRFPVAPLYCLPSPEGWFMGQACGLVVGTPTSYTECLGLQPDSSFLLTCTLGGSR